MLKQIVFPVHLDARSYRQYCIFDAFRLQRRWIAPVLIAAVLTTLALAGLLGFLPIGESAAGLLMGIGLAIPMAAVGMFFIQLERQIQLRGLKDAPLIYTLRLTRDEVQIVNDQKAEPPVRIGWGQLWGAYRREGCVYLYVNPRRALILPDRPDIVSADALWQFIRYCAGEKKCFVLK